MAEYSEPEGYIYCKMNIFLRLKKYSFFIYLLTDYLIMKPNVLVAIIFGKIIEGT